MHDMGGMHGFGPVEPEPNEPPFHERWEGRVLAMQRAMGFTGLWTIDGRPRLARSAAAARLSRLVLLPALVSRARASAVCSAASSARTRSPPADRLRPGMSCRER